MADGAGQGDPASVSRLKPKIYTNVLKKFFTGDGNYENKIATMMEAQMTRENIADLIGLTAISAVTAIFLWMPAILAG